MENTYTVVTLLSFRHSSGHTTLKQRNNVNSTLIQRLKSYCRFCHGLAHNLISSVTKLYCILFMTFAASNLLYFDVSKTAVREASMKYPFG